MTRSCPLGYGEAVNGTPSESSTYHSPPGVLSPCPVAGQRVVVPKVEGPPVVGDLLKATCAHRDAEEGRLHAGPGQWGLDPSTSSSGGQRFSHSS
jgi:hypothetical protein